MTDFRKDMPSPRRFIIYTLVFGCVFCFDPLLKGERGLSNLGFFFAGGCFTGLFLWLIIVTAKEPSPWVKQHIGLLARIGGGIVAALTLWNILAKK
jgi:hypothetical protein